MILRPRTRCVVSPTRGHDVLGKELLGDSFDALCAVVKINTQHSKTSVRADSSASRGAAEEVTVAARLLFAPSVAIKKGDRVVVADIAVRVTEVMPRIGLDGRLDHNQVDGVVWA
jgi:hypothetical protein